MSLRNAIAAELAVAEAKLLEVYIWIDGNEKAKAQAEVCRMKARRYLDALEVLDEMSKEEYQFFSLRITTN